MTLHTNVRDSDERKTHYYRVIAENIQDGLTIIENRKPVYVNDVICRILGYTAEELRMMNFIDLIALEDKPSVSRILERIKRTGDKPTELKFRVVRKDGFSRLLSNRYFQIPGETPAILVITADTTVRQQSDEKIEHAAQEWRATFDAIRDMVWICDEDCNLLRVNKAFADSSASEPRELIGKKCFDILKEYKELCGLCPHKRTLSTKEPASQVVPTGSKYIEISASPVFDEKNEVFASVCVAHDITESRTASKKLQELYSLEKELRRELETEMKQRVEFTRALVHELKTPLTPILASSELLVEELKDEPWLSLAKNVNSGAANLNRRIDELFDLARGEVGMLTLNRQPVDSLTLFNDVVNYVGPVAAGNKQTLISNFETLPVVRADEDRLRQVLLNLLNNALKYTPAGGKIILKAYRKNNQMVVEVKDSGPGINETDQKRLFQPYQRLSKDRERFSGLGLGLALSRMLIELHGGKIWVNSKKDEGSTFGFSIPLDGDGI